MDSRLITHKSISWEVNNNLSAFCKSIFHKPVKCMTLAQEHPYNGTLGTKYPALNTTQPVQVFSSSCTRLLHETTKHFFLNQCNPTCMALLTTLYPKQLEINKSCNMTHDSVKSSSYSKHHHHYFANKLMTRRETRAKLPPFELHAETQVPVC